MTDTDPNTPKIAHGQRVAKEARLVDDGKGGQRASFRLPVDGPLPPDEVSRPEPPRGGGAPVQDVGEAAEGPSVWEALPDSKPAP